MKAVALALMLIAHLHGEHVELHTDRNHALRVVAASAR